MVAPGGSVETASSEQQPGPLSDQRCRACQELLRPRARLCKSCGTYQNRFRASIPHLEATAAVVLATIAGLPTVYRQWREWTGSPAYQIHIAYWYPTGGALAVTNVGTKTGTPIQVAVFPNAFPDTSIQTQNFQTFKPIRPGDTTVLEFHNDLPPTFSEKQFLYVFDYNDTLRPQLGYPCHLKIRGDYGEGSQNAWCARMKPGQGFIRAQVRPDGTFEASLQSPFPDTSLPQTPTPPPNETPTSPATLRPPLVSP